MKLTDAEYDEMIEAAQDGTDREWVDAIIASRLQLARGDS